MRVIAIIGCDFCGSTTLCRLFAAVDNVFSAGETHWLFRQPIVRGRCMVCDPIRKKPLQCSIFTEDFINSCRLLSTVYTKIGSRCNVDTLVISDKTPGHYNSMKGKNIYYEPIILFKSPLAQVVSGVRRNKGSVKQLLNQWNNFYLNAIEWCNKNCSKYLFLNYEVMAQKPFEVMNILCANYNLPKINKEKLTSEEDFHHISGNPEALKKKEIKLDERWKSELTKREIEEINNNDRVNKFYARLLAKSIGV
jgi:hypothetical protein